MAQVFNVAKYILERSGEVTVMKLQKLMYYSQAWHLVWEETPLFEEDFQAWANGPVLPGLYQTHKGQFKVSPSLLPSADGAALSESERNTIDKVLEFYGQQTAQWLSNLTHQERPWLETRGQTAIGATSEAVINKALMHEYYSSI